MNGWRGGRGARRTSVAVTMALVGATGAVIGGCGGGGDPSTPAPPAVRIHVAPGAAGDGDGSADHPYGTIAEALAAAAAGDTIALGAGNYPAAGSLRLTKPLVVVGAGAGATVLVDTILVAAPDARTTVVVRGLRCPTVAFAGGIADDPAAVVVDSCALDDVGVPEPAGHSYAVRSTAIAGDAVFNHAGGSGRNEVTLCAIGGQVVFAHGDGAYIDLVDRCSVAAGVRLRAGDGARTAITECAITGGIDDRSGANTTLIARNAVLGGYADASGGQPGVADQIVEDNTFSGAVTVSATSITLRRNTITVTAAATGVVLSSGPPTVFTGNTVTVPYAAPAGDISTWDQVALRTSAGAGIIADNTFHGGMVGIYDSSGATEIARNTIVGAHHGILTRGDAAFVDNEIRDLAGDGLIIAGDCPGPVSGNAITGCGGAGIRVVQPGSPVTVPVDLGGGARGGPGGNELRGNAGHDLVIELSAAQVDTVFARHNLWDHADPAAVLAADVLDGADDAARAVAAVAPLAAK